VRLRLRQPLPIPIPGSLEVLVRNALRSFQQSRGVEHLGGRIGWHVHSSIVEHGGAAQGGTAMLGPSGDVDALQAVESGVREIVFAMLVDAVRSGQMSRDRAMSMAMPPIGLLHPWERGRVGWEFVCALWSFTPPKGNHLRWPSGWLTANRQIVQSIHRSEKLPRSLTGNRNAFSRAAEVWARWKINVSARQVADAYWRRKTPAKVRVTPHTRTRFHRKKA
jgi:hypothetical protein